MTTTPTAQELEHMIADGKIKLGARPAPVAPTAQEANEALTLITNADARPTLREEADAISCLRTFIAAHPHPAPPVDPFFGELERRAVVFPRKPSTPPEPESAAPVSNSANCEDSRIRDSLTVSDEAAEGADPRRFCGCGKPVEYMVEGGWACNKYARCSPARVIERLRGERDQLAAQVASLVAERDREIGKRGRTEIVLGEWVRAYHYVTDYLPLDDRNFARDPACPLNLCEQDRYRIDMLISRAETAEQQCERLNKAVLHNYEMWVAAETKLAASEAALREAREDAERYRWLRDQSTVATLHVQDGEQVHRPFRYFARGLDDAIDAARAATKEPT